MFLFYFKITCADGLNMQSRTLLIKTFWYYWMWHGVGIFVSFCCQTTIYSIIDLFWGELVPVLCTSINVYSIWLRVCFASVTGAKILTMLLMLIYDDQARKIDIKSGNNLYSWNDFQTSKNRKLKWTRLISKNDPVTSIFTMANMFWLIIYLFVDTLKDVQTIGIKGETIEKWKMVLHKTSETKYKCSLVDVIQLTF